MRLLRHISTGARIGVAAAALLVGACDDGETDDAGISPRSAAAAHDVRATPPPRRGRIIGGETIARRVLWPSVAVAHTPSIDRLAAEKLGASPVPVLVPPDFDDEHILSTGQTWYAFSGTYDGVEVALQGSAASKVIPGIRAPEATHTIRDNPGFVTRNEGLWSVTWTENGAAYSLEIGCTDPYAPPCDDEAFALSWVDALVFAGGREAS